MKVGWNCLKHLKNGWDRTEGREQKDFKKGGGGKLGHGVGALKRGAGIPLQTMDMQFGFMPGCGTTDATFSETYIVAGNFLEKKIINFPFVLKGFLQGSQLKALLPMRKLEIDEWIIQPGQETNCNPACSCNECAVE